MLGFGMDRNAGLFASRRRIGVVSRSADPFVAIKGEMAERTRTLDWSASLLGPPESWTPALINAVSLMLPAHAEIVMFWGADYVALYNDAYAPTIGDKHPRALGRPARENWSELWDDLEPLLRGVRETGETFSAKDRPFYIERTGGVGETVYFDISYSAVRESDGSIGGVLCIVSETTLRVRAEIALRRSEEHLRLATENAGVGLWDIDSEGGIDFSYSRRSSSFVMDRENRVPMTHLLSRLHPEDAPKLEAAYTAARDPAQRAMMDVEYRVLPDADLPLRWIKIRGRGVFDAGGNCLRLTGTALDVTPERETQEALRRSEEQLRLATENAEIGMWDMDVVNNRNFSHPRVKAMFGIPANEDPLSEDFFALIHKDDVARVEAAYAAAFDPQAHATYDVQYRVLGRDGILRWIHAKGRGVFDAAGTCLRVTGTAIDVTKEREITDALGRNEEQLRLATEYADVGLWDIDLVNDIVYWPPRVTAMFGLAPDAHVTMKDFRASIHPDDKRRTIERILAACDPQQRALYDAEYRIVRKNDGAVRWVAAKGRAIFDDAGICVRMLGTILDITPSKEIAQRLQDMNETLEQRVVERTAALERSQAALQQAQKMEAIGNLTGGIAHDFNNLLQGLTGSLDLIRRAPEKTERVRHWAEAGLQAAERGAKLTAQLLAFSRSQKMELKPLNLSALLEGMRDLLGRTLGPSVRVTLDLTADAASVLGDETQLEMAVLNLAINARDAMGGNGALSIQTRPRHLTGDAELAAGDYIELSATDSGEGMPADVIARAFDPFFTTKDVGKGTGLGLSQVYGMARQAGGVARIRSAAGQGTTVSIFLRATSQGAARDARISDKDDLALAAPATILVVDDDPGVRQFLTDSLDSFGYAVLEAQNGEAGLELLARAAPDLMLVDYAMPGMTGAEVARRARETHPHMPIVFASGYAETAALENVLDENTLILRKPFRLSELQDAIAKALRR
jgi:PAS domain S-box-containing protein